MTNKFCQLFWIRVFGDDDTLGRNQITGESFVQTVVVEYIRLRTVFVIELGSGMPKSLYPKTGMPKSKAPS